MKNPGKNFFISDTHFGDNCQLHFQNRPFSSVDEMDKSLIHNWNKKVGRYDNVWIIGDLISHSKHNFTYYLKQLNGKKHLIIGNHDYYLVKDRKALSYFVSVDDYRVITVNGEKIVLSHYPLSEWNGYFKGVHHIYGHIHSMETKAAKYMLSLDRAYNAGCTFNNYEPVDFEEIKRNNSLYK